MLKTALSGIIIAFLIFFVVTQPQHAANIFHGGWHAVVNISHGVGDFLGKLS